MGIKHIQPTKVEEKQKGRFHRFYRMVVFGIKEKLFKSKIFLLIFFLFAFLPICVITFLIYYSTSDLEFLYSLLRIIRNIGSGGGPGNGGPGNGGSQPSLTQAYVSLVYYVILYTVGGYWTTITICFGGLILISDEFHAHTYTYYFTHPVKRYHYLFGRITSLLLPFFLLVGGPFLYGVGIPLGKITGLNEALSFYNLIGVLFGGLLAIFFVLLFQIIIVFAFSTFFQKNFAFLAVLFLYFVSWMVSQLFVYFGGINYYLLSFYFYIRCFIIVLISFLPFGKNLVLSTHSSLPPSLLFSGFGFGVFFFVFFSLLTFWRVK